MSVFGYNQDIIDEFVETTRTDLEKYQAALRGVSVESAPAESIFDIYRVLHTLKGTSGFLDFNHLGDLTGTAEKLAIALRDQEKNWAESMREPFEETGRRIEAILASIEKDGTEGAPDNLELMATFEELCEE